MNKEQFEQMLGGEAEAVRAKYASLVGEVREFVDDIAILGVFTMEFINNVPMIIESMEPDALPSMMTDLFALQFAIVQQLAGNKLQQHHEYLFGDKLDLEDFKDAGDMNTRINRFVDKYKGRGCDGVLDAMKDSLSDDE